MNVKALDNTTMAFEKYFGISVFTSLRDMTPKKKKKENYSKNRNKLLSFVSSYLVI